VMVVPATDELEPDDDAQPKSAGPARAIIAPATASLRSLMVIPSR
jgi:hypothetical protein